VPDKSVLKNALRERAGACRRGRVRLARAAAIGVDSVLAAAACLTAPSAIVVGSTPNSTPLGVAKASSAMSLGAAVRRLQAFRLWARRRLRVHSD
jgi:hypothetical protein